MLAKVALSIRASPRETFMLNLLGSSLEKQALEQSVDAVVTIDPQNRIVFFNAAAERLWNLKRADVIGKNVRILSRRIYKAGMTG
jgi:c-di-GMP-specific phosphodiesterase